ncbi:hypothetical protein EMMF5_004525 [Cystobasidiomycetes sp. EMM_F5]
MLKGCSLCARQLEVSSSQVAKASKLLSQHGSSALTRPANSRAFTSTGYTKSAASDFVNTQADPTTIDRIAHRGAMWKGKGRAIELPPTPYDEQTLSKPYRRVSLNTNQSEFRYSPVAETSNTKAARESLPQAKPHSDSVQDRKSDKAASSIDAVIGTLLSVASAAIRPRHLENTAEYDSIAEKLRVLHERCKDEEEPPDTSQNLKGAMVAAERQDHNQLARLIFSTVLSLLLRRRRFSRFWRPYQQLLANLLERDCPIDEKTRLRIFEDAARATNRSSYSQHVTEIVTMLLSTHRAWTLPLLEAFLSSILANKTYQNVPQITALPKSLYPLPERLYERLILASLINKDFQNARLAFQNMKQHGIKPTIHTYACIIRGYRATGRTQRQLDQDMLNSSTPLDIERNTTMINAFIREHILSNDMVSALKLVEVFDKPSPGYPPETVASERLVGAVVGTGATDSTQPHQTSGLAADAETYALLMEGYSRLGHFQAALHVYRDAMQAGYAPSPHISQALVALYGRQGDISSALQLIERVYDEEDESTDLRLARSRIYDAALSGVLQREGLPGFCTSVKQMTSKRIPLHYRSINRFLSFLGRSPSLLARHVLKAMVEIRTRSAWLPNIATLNTLLSAYFLRERSRARSQRRRGESIARLTSLSVIKTEIQKSAIFTPLYALAKQLQSRGIRTDDATVAVMMLRFAYSGGPPHQLWDYFRRQIIDEGIRPSAQHLSALIICYLNDDDVAGARSAIDRCEILGTLPNIHHYTKLLHYALRADKKTLADEILLHVREKGLKMDLPAYVTLANYHASHGRYPSVRQIANDARSSLSDIAWPNSAMQACLFKSRQKKRDYHVAQVELSKALSDGMLPERRLYQMVADAVQETGANLRKQNRNEMDERQSQSTQWPEAVDVGQRNLSIMKKILSKERGSNSVTEKDIQAAVDTIVTNWAECGRDASGEVEEM